MSKVKRIANLETIYRFVLPAELRELGVVVIGAGGTGGYLLQDLIRYLALTVKEKARLHTIVIDGDIVEEKNLLRQAFVGRDIGMNKARVLAERYSSHFGVPIAHFPGFLESPDQLYSIINSVLPSLFTSTDSHVGKFILTCVDNNKTRALVHHLFNRIPNLVWIDTGNEKEYGQVVSGYNSGTRMDAPMLSEALLPTTFRLPTVIELYPEMLDHLDKLPTELSCAEHAVSAPQTIFANRMASLHMLNMIYAIVTRTPIQYNAIRFDILTNASATRKFTNVNLAENKRLVEAQAEFDYAKLIAKPKTATDPG